jgi:hypothetical protein
LLPSTLGLAQMKQIRRRHRGDGSMEEFPRPNGACGVAYADSEPGNVANAVRTAVLLGEPNFCPYEFLFPSSSRRRHPCVRALRQTSQITPQTCDERSFSASARARRSRRAGAPPSCLCGRLSPGSVSPGQLPGSPRPQFERPLPCLAGPSSSTTTEAAPVAVPDRPFPSPNSCCRFTVFARLA